jgi:predicted nucleic acid-binding protein
VSFYLDTNVLVALLIPEPLSARADAFLSANRDVYLVSNLAAAEFSSAISRQVRTSEITVSDGRIALSSFDALMEQSARRVEIAPPDIACADNFLRQLDVALLTPDAIHIATAQRLQAVLVTFDRQMAASARALGIAVATP